MKSISEIVGSILKHKLITLLIILIVFFIPILAIHFLFRNYNNLFWTPVWTAGELLGYCAAFVATCGTVLISAVAIRQTENMGKEQRKIQKEKEIRRIGYIKPILEFKYIHIEYPNPTVFNDDKSNVILRIFIENKSSNEMINVRVIKIEYSHETGKEDLTASGLTTNIIDKMVFHTNEFWLCKEIGFFNFEIVFGDYEHHPYRFNMEACYNPDKLDFEITKFEINPQFSIDD